MFKKMVCMGTLAVVGLTGCLQEDNVESRELLSLETQDAPRVFGALVSCQVVAEENIFSRDRFKFKHSNLTAGGNISIGYNSTFDGDLTANGAVQLGLNGFVAGTVTPNAGVALAPLMELDVNVGNSDLTVNHDETIALTPGSWDEITVRDRATVTFAPGVYHVRRFTTGNDVTLDFAGEGELRVAQDFKGGDRLLITIDADGEAAVYSSGKASLNNDAKVTANFLVPNGEFSTGDRVKIVGYIQAKNISFSHDDTLDVPDCPELPDFPNGGTFVDSRDGQEYRYVDIANQRWMAENLNYDIPGYPSYCYEQDDVYSGSNIQLDDQWYGFEHSEFPSDTILNLEPGENGCDYGYGRLYTLDDIEQMQADGVNICPAGYRYPDVTDYDELAFYVDAETENGGKDINHTFHTVGKYMKSADYWTWDGAGEDPFGFRMLPAGYYNTWQDFYYGLGEVGSIWTSNNSSGVNSSIFMKDKYDYWKYVILPSYYAFSVRCIAE